jgi:predicted metal-dependent phosphoesterase TrpH
VKVELHTHTSDDPADRIPHTSRDLIDHAASLGYGGLAITLHDKWLDPAPHTQYARERGVTLIPGIERTIAGTHMLLVNAPAEAARVRTWTDLAALRQRSDVLVIAPHPFFPTFTAIGRAIDTHADLVDAVEYNAMYTPLVNFNRRAEAWARAHGKPMVGNADVHRLEQLGMTASIVDVEDGAAPDEICAAIRAGRVRLETAPLSLVRAGWLFARMSLGGAHPLMHDEERDAGD